MGATSGRIARSSLGRKALVALSGLALVGFLVTHVGGNLTLLADADGAAYDEYAAGLRRLGPLLWIARIALAATFTVHIALVLRLAAENRARRGARYVAPGAVRRTASRSMLVSGLVLAAFLLWHVAEFSLDDAFVNAGAGLVRERLRDPWRASLYATVFTVLALHLWHAIPSALHSLGFATGGASGGSTGARRAGRLLAVAIAVGFGAVLVGALLR